MPILGIGMITGSGTALDHWNFLIALDEDLARLSRFVEFTRPNLRTYSIEILRILMAASAEAEVVAKQLCYRLQPGRDVRNINDYRSVLMQSLKVVAEVEVRMDRYDLKFKPWSNWKRRVPSNPDWWGAYNDVKHHRYSEYRKANLRHALNAVAALYVLAMFFYEEQATVGKLEPHPSLLIWGEPFGQESVLYSPDGGRLYRFERLRPARRRSP